jgi:hypothetical protein
MACGQRSRRTVSSRLRAGFTVSPSGLVSTDCGSLPIAIEHARFRDTNGDGAGDMFIEVQTVGTMTIDQFMVGVLF